MSNFFSIPPVFNVSMKTNVGDLEESPVTCSYVFSLFLSDSFTDFYRQPEADW